MIENTRKTATTHMIPKAIDSRNAALVTDHGSTRTMRSFARRMVRGLFASSLALRPWRRARSAFLSTGRPVQERAEPARDRAALGWLAASRRRGRDLGSSRRVGGCVAIRGGRSGRSDLRNRAVPEHCRGGRPASRQLADLLDRETIDRCALAGDPRSVPDAEDGSPTVDRQACSTPAVVPSAAVAMPGAAGWRLARPRRLAGLAWPGAARSASGRARRPVWSLRPRPPSGQSACECLGNPRSTARPSGRLSSVPIVAARRLKQLVVDVALGVSSDRHDRVGVGRR